MPLNAATEAARLSTAPMMDWTDRHCRWFHRQLTQRAQVFTEMVTSGAVIHGDRDHLIGFDAAEQPVVLQLGGSDPDDMARASEIAAAFGYAEVNINVGCPSDRVQSGCFGAALMRDPDLVGRLVAAMRDASGLSVTVKCRIGVDDQDPGPALDAMADSVFASGCDALWVHARKAWLKGLSPKENRDVPPLDYQRVYDLKARLPEAWIGINGGIETLAACEHHLTKVDGVMLGRAAYKNPMLLADVDHVIYGEVTSGLDLEVVCKSLVAYAEQLVEQGGAVRHLARHLHGLFQGVPGARQFRRHLADNAMANDASPQVIEEAFALVLQSTHEARTRYPDMDLPQHIKGALGRTGDLDHVA